MHATWSHARREEGGFDARAPHPEVRQRVDRRRDRQLKLETGRASPAAGAADRCVRHTVSAASVLLMRSAGCACVAASDATSTAPEPCVQVGVRHG
jgi:hypothetical protein